MILIPFNLLLRIILALLLSWRPYTKKAWTARKLVLEQDWNKIYFFFDISKKVKGASDYLVYNCRVKNVFKLNF